MAIQARQRRLSIQAFMITQEERNGSLHHPVVHWYDGTEGDMLNFSCYYDDCEDACIRLLTTRQV